MKKDYTSPQLIDMLRITGQQPGGDPELTNILTYEAAEKYVRELWDLELRDIMSPEEYGRISEELKIDTAMESHRLFCSEGNLTDICVCSVYCHYVAGGNIYDKGSLL